MNGRERALVHAALAMREQADLILALLAETATTDDDGVCSHPHKQDITPAGTTVSRWYCPDCGATSGGDDDEGA